MKTPRKGGKTNRFALLITVGRRQFRCFFDGQAEVGMLLTEAWVVRRVSLVGR